VSEAASREAGPYIRAEYSEYANPEYGEEVQLWETMFDDFREKSFLFGSADTIVEKINDFAEAGFNHFVFRTSWSGMPFEQSLRNIERFATKVIPRFEAAKV
jgi:alkanesulfonate monooxygenase SsuD/methylene tetrahydromethanopterin reductase-like flavin-dependent oxidoreductase (luciferase family)